MIRINIIEKILYALFSDDIISSKDFKRLNSDQLNDIYNYLYKQKILQLSYNYLKQLPTDNEYHAEKILLKTSEYIEKTKFRDNMLRNGLYSLSNTLIQNNIEHISLKGPLFSDIYFKSEGKRVCGDIDILVNKCDVLRTKDVLKKAGYYIDDALYEKSLLHHYHFEAKKDNVTFEIHWNIDYGRNAYWEYLFHNSYFRHLSDIQIRVLNNEGQFLLFIVSISKDWFTKAGVNKYLDLLQIVKHENMNFSDVFKAIEKFDLINRCYIVLFCLQHFYKNKMWPTVRTSLSTKIFAQCFLTKRKILLCKPPYKLTRKLGEQLLWKDSSFTSVPNIYKNK